MQQQGFGIILIVFLIIITFNYAFKNGNPTCKNYMTNTYLYLGLSITILGLFSSILPKTGKHADMIRNGFFLWFVLLIGMIIWFAFIPAKNVIGTHFVWLMLILLFGFLISPMIGLSTGSAIVQAIMITIFIFVAMSIVAVMFEDKLRGHLPKIGAALLITLISILTVCESIIQHEFLVSHRLDGMIV